MKVYLEELENGDVVTLVGDCVSARIVRSNDAEPTASVPALRMASVAALSEQVRIVSHAIMVLQFAKHPWFIGWVKGDKNYVEGPLIYPPSLPNPDLEAAAEQEADGSVEN